MGGEMHYDNSIELIHFLVVGDSESQQEFDKDFIWVEGMIDSADGLVAYLLLIN